MRTMGERIHFASLKSGKVGSRTTEKAEKLTRCLCDEGAASLNCFAIH